MAFKHYDVVRAASPSDLAEKLTHKLKEGWQPFGSPVAITPYTLMQAIAAEGDVVVSGATEPEWYYVIVLAGQSNAMAYGEGLPLPDSYDAPHPRIKQLARRNTVTPGGEVCVFNDIIPADHCLHDVQDMSTINHPRADLSKGQYGCVGQGLHIAKKLLPYIPNNAGILLVPCCRGGSAFTKGTEGTFSESTGASQDSARWGVGKPLYQDLLFRTKAALQKNPKNVLLAICWMQGEFDMSAATYAQQDGVFKVTKQSNKTWSLMHPVDDAVSLLTRGGRLSCKFRLSGALTNNQFGLGIYLYTDVALPDVVAMTGTGNPFLMSFFTQTTDGKLNLMHHKKAGNTKLGEFGNYSNDWQTLELVFTAGSATVTPKLNGVAGPAFQVIKDSLTLGLNALTLTDITKNAAYGVEIESLVLEINAPASS
ncbi:DUF1737 domain-containing protein [Escherichia coli]|nr:DUF1737 domain-containing protein [Escherichia coli]EFB3789054.1 DUF1737 domain-containing protein [Escherichia coli]